MRLPRPIRRLLRLVVAVCLLLALPSCSLKPPAFLFAPSSEKQQEEKLQKQIMSTINTRDIAKIKALFSKDARAHIVDLDNKLAKFLAFYQGEYVSSIYVNAPEDYNGDGSHQKMYDYFIMVKTDQEDYVIECEYIVSNRKSSEKIGAFRLDIIKSANAPASVSWHSIAHNTPDVQCHDQ